MLCMPLVILMRKYSDFDVMSAIYRMSSRNEATGCLEFNGHRHYKGYGTIRFRGKMDKTHRVVFQGFCGPLAPGEHILHHCDNRACCEISHLYKGSNDENIMDKCVRDRSGKKLCIADVVEIKKMLKAGQSSTSIALMYGVGQPSISKIKTGERWRHVHID